ncbi:MAG: hypothetical protein GDA55_08585 [Cellvibrionales bacterium]|nr:hypothetical protein [Cellvibrionales bacterium]
MRRRAGRVSHLAAALTSAIALTLTTPPLFAQPNEGDLEIYASTDPSWKDGTSRTQPNLLLIADTSLDMRGGYPVPWKSYDPNADYGDPDDDRIYVYNGPDHFSGVTITPEQNRCQAMKDEHQANPKHPRFVGRAIQWHPQTSTRVIAPGEETCHTVLEPVGETTTNVFGRTGYNYVDIPPEGTQPFKGFYPPDSDRRNPKPLKKDGFHTRSSLTFKFRCTALGGRVCDQPITATISAIQLNKRGRTVTGIGGFGPPSHLVCEQTYPPRPSGGTNYITLKCDAPNLATIPFENYQLQIDITGRPGMRLNDGELTYGSTAEREVEKCVTGPDLTEEGPDGRWSDQLETRTEPHAILECEADFGRHGINDTSEEKYPAHCDNHGLRCDYRECTLPRSDGGCDRSDVIEQACRGESEDQLCATPSYTDNPLNERTLLDKSENRSNLVGAAVNWGADDFATSFYSKIKNPHRKVNHGIYHFYPAHYHHFLQSLRTKPPAVLADSSRLATKHGVPEPVNTCGTRLQIGAQQAYPRREYRSNDPYCEDWVVAQFCRNPSAPYVRNTEDGPIYRCENRVDAVIDAFEDLVRTSSGINIGLMHFNPVKTALNTGFRPPRLQCVWPYYNTTRFYPRENFLGWGGSVVHHVQDVGGPTSPARTRLQEQIADLKNKVGIEDEIPSEASGCFGPRINPRIATFYEAYRYWTGTTKKFGFDPSENPTRVQADPASQAGGRYRSPYQHECQANHIVYAGRAPQPTHRALAPDVESVTGGGTCPRGSRNCVAALAKHMATRGIRNHAGLKGKVTTHTIGFESERKPLQAIATAGGGKHYTVESYEGIKEALQGILTQINLDQSLTLTAPALTIDAFTPLRHDNRLYYSTFTPQPSPAWQGNVKKYGLSDTGIVHGQAGPTTPALDANGFFRATAQSYWSTTPDGNQVTKGGYREHLTAERKLYLDGSLIQGGTAGTLTQVRANSILKPGPVGATDATDAANLRDWLLGIDVHDSDEDGTTTDPHHYAPDSLHSRPTLITYPNDRGQVLFIATNKGSLHAIDAADDSGQELWVHIPKPLINRAKTYRDNPPAKRKWDAYGLDGPATAWVQTNPFKAYLFQGQRRGGRNYFAFDVTRADRTSGIPVKPLWTIKGNSGKFKDLGFTWSKMVRTQIRGRCEDARTNTGCLETRDALVFTGGYHGYYDTPSNPFLLAPSNHIAGNAVFIVDADNGKKVWSAGPRSAHELNEDPTGATLPMYDSIPADPAVVDIDGDGDMDMLFVIDISGKIFRFDFDQTKKITDKNYATGGMIASLRDGGKRRFYNGLDVAYLSPPGTPPYLTLSVGSGYRAAPKQEEPFQNRFHVLIDENLNVPPRKADGTLEDPKFYQYRITRNADGDITTRKHLRARDLVSLSNTQTFTKGVDGDYGFYHSFPQGEKVLQESATFAGHVLVSTYVPESQTQSATPQTACGGLDIGSGKAYRFNLANGESLINDGIVLETPGIPPQFSFLPLKDGIGLCIGTLCTARSKDTSIENNALDRTNLLPHYPLGTARRTFWREEED